jgi:hypothetical protein
MTTPVEQERSNLNALVQALAYTQGAEAVTEALLGFTEVTPDGVRLLFTISQIRGLVRLAPRPGAHAAVQATHRLNLMRRAGYLVMAARRVTGAARRGPEQAARALVVERRYLRQHLDAMAQREVVADQVAATARQQRRVVPQETGLVWNGLLGWYAVNDEVTSAECKRAHGRNFDPTQVPSIGFPGAVHPNCRCKPGPPFKTDRRVESVRSDRDAATQRTPKRVTIGA